MIRITLPDYHQREFAEPVTVRKVAEMIGIGLANAAVAGKVNGRLVDTDYLIEKDSTLQIITGKDKEGLDIIRHSTAHLLAHAVKSLFPSIQVAIGPVIEDGFYYDFSFERPFTPQDLEQIELKMKALAKADYPVEHQSLSRDEAIAIFQGKGETYKVEIIKNIAADETLTVYRQEDFIDLCRGPHVPRTGMLKVFKLMKLAGAYWQGDSKNPMLQRIYGTAWSDKKDLQGYLQRLEEAEKRDHRKIGRKMDLFHFQPEAPGMVFWHPKGWVIARVMREYLRDLWCQSGYQEVNTPQIMDMSLWEKSGHFEKFNEEMFALHLEHRDYAVKPMSCPCHVQIYKQGVKSYRDLPLRLAEFGCCHRNEPSGTLHGLMRVRAMIQDDGHIFCTEDQIHEEVLAFIRQLHVVYKDFGFTDIIYKLSTRPEKRVGSDAIWDKAEDALTAVLNASEVDWEILPGEGAFYGPKIEFSLKDCLGRVWQCGTMQVDFMMPQRLEAEYVTETGEKQTPVMLHRAILGSIERFMGILLEHYEGWLPLWLAPVQIAVMNISDSQGHYATEIGGKLQDFGFRVITDLRNEKIGFKIRQHTVARIPYQVVIGEREVVDKTLSVRQQTRGVSEEMSLDKLVHHLKSVINQKVDIEHGDRF